MLKLSREQVRAISLHAEKTFPEECCGVLLGNVHEGVSAVKEAKEIANTQDENRERRFLISPRQYMQIERDALAQELDVLGFYHSHPNHPAEPSVFDLEHALPYSVYVIVSVMGGRSGHMTAWRLHESRTRFDELPIVIED